MATFGTTIFSGGIRFYDANHTVAYNYVEGVGGGNFQGPLLLDSGDAEGASTNLAGHWRVVNALVERNVLIGNPEGIRYGNNYSLAPTGCVVRDNVVAQASSGAAETVLITPVATTRTNNTYAATPAGAGLAQGSDTIWRKAGFGPRVTYLQAADVGITGDPNDADGTGVLLPGSIPPGGNIDSTSAAYKYGWGNPLAASDEFDYTGAPDPTKWAVYNGAGHDGNGLRSPSRVTVGNGVMTLTGLDGSANTAGLAQRLDQQYGRWEVRCRSYYTNNPTAPGNQTGGYHPVLIVWPTSDAWPGDGEYDLLETGEPGMPAADAFMHYPSLDGANHQIDVPNYSVDLKQFHNFAFEWSPDGVTGWVDGTQWFTYSGGAAAARRNIQDMPRGHLTVQLDAFQATGCIASTFEVEWARVYSLTPSTPPAGVQTLYPTGIGSGHAFGFPTLSGGETGAPPGSTATTLGSANTYLGTATLGYTVPTGGGTTPPPAGGQTVAGAGNIASGQALGVPVLSVADGPQTVVPVGLVTAAAFGSPTVVGGAPPAPAAGGVLVPALFAVSADGATLTPLPAWTKITVSPVRNSAGAVTVDYPAGAPGFATLHDGVSAYPLRALEIRVWLGGNATGALGGWLLQKSGDDLTPGANWTFTGAFHEWILSKAIVAPQPRSSVNEKGELRFAGATAGLVLATLMDQAQARGALPLVSRDFTATTDSNGRPWAQQISSLNLAPKTKISDVADKLVELGMCEYELTAARVWRAYNPGTRGVDRTLGGSPLVFAHAQNLSEHARRESAKDAGTAVLAAGGEGFYEWASSATAQAELGWRAEVGVDAGQVSTQSGVQAAAATQLEILRNGVAEHNGAILFAPGSPLPLIDYGVGDWAYTFVNGRRARLRIAQVTLEFAAGAPPKGTVVLNDLITDRITALYRRLNAITTGDAVVGTSVSTPGGGGDDFNPPAAPTGLTVASNIAYRTPGETSTLAMVRVGWAAVTTSAYPDNDTARKAQAAELISARMRSGENIFEDWTWSSAPTVVGDYNGILLTDWQNAGSPNPAADWLDAWVLGVRGGPVTDDVASYRVQYAYLGGSVLSGGSGTVGQITDWQEPLGSPTTGLSLDFGNIEAARAVGVRVAATDRAGNQGPWSEILAFNSAVDDVPPPRPSKPIATVWFETMNITWDGKGAAGEDMVLAAPDFAGVGGGLEVHVGTGIDFIPDRPVGPDGRFAPGLSGTYKATLYTAGTWNVTDLTIGVTYFARFVAVDATGNASEPSDTSAGVLPQQLVQIDIGPDAIGRAQIIDGEIVNAKIANLAVNDAKVSDLSVGKLTAGTMSANVVMGGRFTTPPSNNNHLEFDAAGIRLYQGNTVVGRWQVADASMLVTGTYLSGLSGERVNILPDGTLRFYQQAGVDYSEMSNNGSEVLWRGPVAAPTTTRHGYVSVSASRVYIGYGARGALTMSHIACQNENVEIRAPIVGFRVERRFGALATPNSNPYQRYVFIQQDTAGNEYSSYIHMYQNGVQGKPGNTQEQQIIFDPVNLGLIGSSFYGGLLVCRFNMTEAPITASSFNVASSITRKTKVTSGIADDDELLFSAYQAAPARRWRYKMPGDPVDDNDPNGPRIPNVEPPPLRRRMRNLQLNRDRWEELPDDHPDKWSYREVTRPPEWEAEHFFPVAEDLEAARPDLVLTTPGGGKVVDLRDFAGFMWETLRRLIPRLQGMDDRLTAIEHPPTSPDPKEPRG